MENNFNLDSCVNAIEKEYEMKRRLLLVKDIIDINHHQFHNYSEYVDTKRKIIANAESAANPEFDKDALSISRFIYVRPIILDEDTFNYILGINSEKKPTPKKYLTWDDIMKLKLGKIKNGVRSKIRYKVLLNGSEYKMELYQLESFREMWLIKEGEYVFGKVGRLLNVEEHKSFINDLHLELVEE